MTLEYAPGMGVGSEEYIWDVVIFCILCCPGGPPPLVMRGGSWVDLGSVRAARFILGLVGGLVGGYLAGDYGSLTGSLAGDFGKKKDIMEK